MPILSNTGIFSSGITTPATINGPITGPRPASSIPKMFICSPLIILKL
ncbi:hypothetical protein [Methanobrevibacter arboriphilus]|nr:hypothetical protein [Methanobrevibacter arboriphilus]